METQITMTPGQLEVYLDFVFANPDAGITPIIAGPPGCGKSDIVEGCSKKATKQFILTHPVMDDPTDYKGLGVLVNGEAIFLTFGNLKALVNADSPTVCFLDDVGQASHAVQAALMQLVLARRVNGHKVSHYVQFVMATNRKSDRAGVASLLEPLKGRGTMLTLQPTKDDWLKWAYANGMPPELTAFINFRPEFITGFKASAAMTNSPTARTIAAVGRHFNAGVPKEVEFAAYAGCTGEEFAREFTGFLDICQRAPNPQNCIMNPDTARVPDNSDLSTLYAICGAVERLATPNNIGAVLRYAARLPEEFHVSLVRGACRYDPDLEGTDEVIQWGIKNSDLIC